MVSFVQKISIVTNFYSFSHPPLTPAKVEGNCVLASKTPATDTLYVSVNGMKIRIELIIWRLFKGNWRETWAILHSRKKIIRSCGRNTCLKPDHYSMSMKKMSNEMDLEAHITIKVDKFKTIDEMKKSLEEEFPNSDVQIFGQAVNIEFFIRNISCLI